MESFLSVAIVPIVAVAMLGVVRGLDVRLVLLVAALLIGGLAGDLRPVVRVFLETFSNEKYVVPLCSAMGFAYVLKHSGCDAQLVNLLIGPVRRLRWLMVPGVVMAGFVVNIPVVSQSSTAVCLGTVAVPLMRSAGFSPVTIGATLLLGSSVGGELLNPGAVELATVKDKTGTETRELSFRYIPPVLFPLVVVAVGLFWWRSSTSTVRASGLASQESPSPLTPLPQGSGGRENAQPLPPRGEGGEQPNYLQAAVPLLPLVLLFLSGSPHSPLPIPDDWVAVASKDLPEPKKVVVSRLIGLAMLVGVMAAAVAAPRKAAGCMKAFFDGAGYAFANIVSLIVVAQCFSTALVQAGMAEGFARLIRENRYFLEPLAAAVPCLFAVICGSGIASSQGLYPLFHGPSVALGENPDEIGALVSVGSAVGRTLSPVSAVALMCGMLAGVKAADLVKRLAFPLLLGLTTTVVLHACGAWGWLREGWWWVAEPTGPVTLTDDQLSWMPAFYLFTVAVEMAVLWVALSRRHGWRVKVFAGFWLTACTYPVLWLVLPPLFNSFRLYLLVGEALVPVLECLLFWLVFIRGRPADSRATFRDLAAIVLANLASFGLGLLLNEVW